MHFNPIASLSGLFLRGGGVGRPPPAINRFRPPSLYRVKTKNYKEAALYSGGFFYCIAEALTAWWRIGLPNKYGRLVSACRRLMASRVSQNMLIEGHNIHYKGHSNLNVA